jgi:hypothetical protein
MGREQVKYLIVTVGYQSMAVPAASTELLATLFAALSDSVQVDSNGSGAEQRWVPTTGEPLEIAICKAERVTVGDELGTLKAKLAKLETDSANYSKWWAQERTKVAELEKKLKSATTAEPAAAPAPTAEELF